MRYHLLSRSTTDVKEYCSRLLLLQQRDAVVDDEVRPGWTQIQTVAGTLALKRHSRTWGMRATTPYSGPACGATSSRRWNSHSAPSSATPILPVSGYSATSGQAFDETINTRATSPSRFVSDGPLRGLLGAANIPLGELAITIVESDRGLAAQDDDQLLASVVEVVDELSASRLKLPDRSTERSVFGTNETPRTDSAPVRDIRPDVVRVTRQSDAT